MCEFKPGAWRVFWFIVFCLGVGFEEGSRGLLCFLGHGKGLSPEDGSLLARATSWVWFVSSSFSTCSSTEQLLGSSPRQQLPGECGAFSKTGRYRDEGWTELETLPGLHIHHAVPVSVKVCSVCLHLGCRSCRRIVCVLDRQWTFKLWQWIFLEG